MIHMLLAGPIVPYTRMTRRGVWRDDAQRYLASQTALRVQMQSQMAANGWAMIPAKVPLRVHINFGWCSHRNDLSNLVKAVEDAANGVVFADDRWIDSLTTWRPYGAENVVDLWVEAKGGDA